MEMLASKTRLVEITSTNMKFVPTEDGGFTASVRGHEGWVPLTHWGEERIKHEFKARAEKLKVTLQIEVNSKQFTLKVAFKDLFS